MIYFRRSNEIENCLIVSGPVLDVKRFVATSKGLPWQIIHAKQNGQMSKNMEPQFCFNSLVPMPKDIFAHLLEPEEDGQRITKGEAWLLRNWGTTFDVYGDDIKTSLDITDTTAKFVIMFDTLECPENWVITVAKQFPSLEFFMESIAFQEQEVAMRLYCKGTEHEFLPITKEP